MVVAGATASGAVLHRGRAAAVPIEESQGGRGAAGGQREDCASDVSRHCIRAAGVCQTIFTSLNHGSYDEVVCRSVVCRAVCVERKIRVAKSDTTIAGVCETKSALLNNIPYGVVVGETVDCGAIF